MTVYTVYQVVGFKVSKKQFLKMFNYKEYKHNDEDCIQDFLSEYHCKKILNSEMTTFRLLHDCYPKNEDGMLIGIPILVYDLEYRKNVSEVSFDELTEAVKKVREWIKVNDPSKNYEVKLYTTSNDCSCCS